MRLCAAALDNLKCFKMCGGLFSFCFLHETVFGNGQVAIAYNGCGFVQVGILAPKPN